MKVLSEGSSSVSIQSWADRIDRPSLEVLRKLARCPRLAAPIAVMPDVHFADGVCVGTVFATSDCVLPSAVGNDLGCGMSTAMLELDAHALQRRDLEAWLGQTRLRVPCGRSGHTQPQRLPEALQTTELSARTLEHARDFLGTRHFGTLGEGNHFIELQRDAEGRLYVTVHSGSRGIGAQIARHHAHAAQAVARVNGPLAALEAESVEARNFFNDLKWALDFAAANRRRMLDDAARALEAVTNRALACEVLFDAAHNVISHERIEGRELIVHRKGAMAAPVGARGIIPGSMGTASYLVEGRGHPASFNSCSHGAGRRYSRTEARARIPVRELRRQMTDVVLDVADPRAERALVEEAPGAYKDIREVLDAQQELMKPLRRLTPLAVVKG